jgi:hypothetical protein
MTAEPPQSPDHRSSPQPGGALDLPGQLETAVAGWFGRFPAAVESREDTFPLFGSPPHS